MDSITEKINNTRYLEGQIAFPKNGTTHIISTEELLSLLEAVAEEQDAKTLSCLDWGGIPQLNAKERLVTNQLKQQL